MASSCKGFFSESLNLSDEESITFHLPSWPPKDELQQSYPDLTSWLISIESEDCSKKFTLPVSSPENVSPDKTENGITISGSTITLKAKKNKPLSITAQPITEGVLFFKQAGFIYPYDCISSGTSTSKNNITWSQGFLATVMENIFKNKNYSKSELNDFISHFNWKKASEIIKNKLNNSEEHYNPWLLNETRLMEKICSKKASSIYFNMSSTEEVPLSSLIANQDQAQEDSHSSKGTSPTGPSPTILSSFIPENSSIPLKKSILLKKQQPTLIFTSKNTGIMCTYYSINKISLEYILLPIYIEGI